MSEVHGLSPTSADAPLVSVVVPCFNAAATIGATLTSLRNQVMSAWGAVVVDDGSTDGTTQVVEALAREEPRIRLICANHAGPSAARNAGVKAARADWLLFLDSDDELSPDHLAIMTDHAEADPTGDVFYCGWQDVSDAGEGRLHRAPDLTDPFPVTATRCPFAIHSALTRRRAVVAAEGFDAALRSAEDWDLWQKLARLGFRFTPVEGVFARYTLRRDSLCKDLEALLACGLQVIRRGHGPDPRLGGVTGRWLGGLAQTELPHSQAVYAAWIYGGALGQQEGPAFVARALDLCRGWDPDPTELAAALLSGAARTIDVRAGSWLETWPQIAPGVEAFLQLLEQQSGSPRLTRRTLRYLEQNMSLDVGPTALADLGALAIRPIELGLPLAAIDLSAQTERVECVVRREGEVLGRFHLAASGRVEVGDYQAILRAEFGVPPVPIGPLWRETLKGISRRLLGRARPRRLPASAAEPPSNDASAPAYWDEVFASPDPWGYESPYERLKYQQTLSIIPPGRYGDALELACAEGHFTVDLATRVERLLATDISPVALERAAARCADLGNVRFAQLDLLRDPLPGVYDLIVCSEVLYYLPDAEALRGLASRLADHLSDHGLLVLAHANLVVDDPAATGFRWPHPFGAVGIGRAVAQDPLLALEREFRTELYTVQLFRKAPPGSLRRPPSVVHGPFAREIPEQVAKLIRWKGGCPDITLRRARGLPVLTYHRVAEDGPEALRRYRVPPAAFDEQMSHLRRTGYTAISLTAFEAALWGGGELPEKPVLITFDDGYRDMFVNAAPILREHGHRAAIFLVTDCVGGSSIWDQRFGQPAELMGWGEVEELAAAGHEFGVHGRRHISMMGLSPSELELEFQQGARTLTERLGGCSSLAYPHGEHDEGVARTALRHGFRLGFSCREGGWRPGQPVMAVPRLTVTGDMSLDAFRQLLVTA